MGEERKNEQPKKKNKKARASRRLFFISFLLSLAVIAGTVCAVIALKDLADRRAEERRAAESKTVEATTSLPETEREEKPFDPKEEGVVVTEDEPDSIEDVLTVEEWKAEEVTLVFAGDVCFDDGYSIMGSFRNAGSDIDNCIDAGLLERMRNADICMVNNEFPYSLAGAPCPGKTYTFRSKPENVEILKDMGVDIVSLANNHVYDYGEEALLDTLKTLANAEIPCVGAGRDLEEASKPYYFEIGGHVIAYLSATQVERTGNPETKGATASSPGAFRCYTDAEFANLTSRIKEADEKADVVIVYIHWGTENTDKLHWAQESQAPAIVSAGADLVIGDHPHCLQPIEYIDGVPVFYSLGNYWFNSKTLDTCLVEVRIKEDHSVEPYFIAAKQHNCRTDIPEESERLRIVSYMQCISPEVTIEADGRVSDTPYAGPAIDYSAVQRVPAPPAPQPADPNAAVPVTDPNAAAPQTDPNAAVPQTDPASVPAPDPNAGGGP